LDYPLKHWQNCEKNMENLKTGGVNGSDSDLNPLPSLKQDTSSERKTLTPSEKDWLRRNKRKATEVMQQALDDQREAFRPAS